MESAELEALIEELEQRVERLRALYDQYFMGLEKIEPSVLRKDVDRRLWVLRREQIRNTGLRFKLNTIVQRYNTYQQYWMRICREIENGTYKRDLRRAAKKFGTEVLTIQAKKRLGKQLQRELETQEQESRPQQDDQSFDVDVELEEEPAQAPALPRKRPAAHIVSLDDLDNLEDVLGLATAQERAPAQPRRAAPSFGRLDNILEEDDADQTRPHERTGLSAAQARAAPPLPGRSAGSPAPPLPPRRPSPPVPPAQPQADLPPAPPGLGLARKAPPQAPPATAQGQLTPAQQARPPARPAPPLPPARPVAPAAPPNAARAGADASLSDNRVREIYAKYVQAKRECRESTSGITEDGLSRSLRATAEKLKTQHKGRQIDFDVVIKDGKAVLKPVVKG